MLNKDVNLFTDAFIAQAADCSGEKPEGREQKGDLNMKGDLNLSAPFISQTWSLTDGVHIVTLRDVPASVHCRGDTENTISSPNQAADESRVKHQGPGISVPTHTTWALVANSPSAGMTGTWV